MYIHVVIKSTLLSDYPIIWLKRFWYATGLCGHYDGDNSNDLMFPSGRLYSGKERRPKDFSKSWRLELTWKTGHNYSPPFSAKSISFKLLVGTISVADFISCWNNFVTWAYFFPYTLKEYHVILQVVAREKRYKAYHVPKQKLVIRISFVSFKK